jgi:4-hydroxy-tetrahydrodipicolinate synthase
MADFPRRLRDALARGVVAAPVTPFAPEGGVRWEAVAPYAAGLAARGIAGLAVGAHTGRGPMLPVAERARLIVEFRTGSGLPVVAGVSLPPDGHATGAALRDGLLRAAEPAAASGAAALLCFPPATADRDPDAVAALHADLAAQTGLPVVAFLLYEAASGFQYGPAVLEAVAQAPGVAAVKLALLDDAIACQDAIALLRRVAPDVALLTGEDRMLGPSLMWGCDGALVGAAAALPQLSVEVLSSWHDGRLEDFLRASKAFDAFAGVTFRRPMEGYVQRLAWAAEAEGLLPPGGGRDPWAPAGLEGERDEVRAWVASALSATP